VICVSGVGVIKEFSTLITKIIPDLELVGKSQCFPLYYYESTRDHPAKTIEASQSVLFEAETTETETTYTRKDGVSDFILTKARTQYQHSGITKEDIFYYVYGFLHSPGYRETFSADLKKMLPRIPLVENYHDFMAFSNAGRMLADLHLHYETVPPYPDVDVSGLDSGSFRVKKMKFPKKDQKDTIHYNESITISGIPEKAYAYIVNGRSALEWIMDRYQVTTDKDSGITNDPNDWAEESGNPRYILDLILRVITVSIQTMEIVEKLPKVEFA
jgi:predicted helicase